MESSTAGAPRAVAVDEIEGALSDNARFSVFQLADATLKGEARRCDAHARSLRAEGMEPVLVLWALTRWRARSPLSVRVAAGESAGQALDAARVWSRRNARCALRRSSGWRQPPGSAFCNAPRASTRVIKGRATGDTWCELQNLALAMSGLKPLSA